jgi:hypothetical protein
MQIPTTRFRGGLPPRATLWAYPSADLPNGTRANWRHARADRAPRTGRRRHTTSAASDAVAPTLRSPQACTTPTIRRSVQTGAPNLIETRDAGNATGMGIGVGIFLIVVGAILTFALDATVAGINLDVVGWILMLAGAAGLVLFFYFWNRGRAPRAVVSEQRTYDDAGQQPPM